MQYSPATKAFKIKSDFLNCEVPGSVHNNSFIVASGILEKCLTIKTNNSSGIQGEISNGNSVYIHSVFKSPATGGQAQIIAWYAFDESTLEAKGQHELIVVSLKVPTVEAMTALAIINASMAQSARRIMKNFYHNWEYWSPDLYFVIM